MPGKKKHPRAAGRLIVFMTNAMHYQLEYVIIFIEKQGFRLVVMDTKNLVTNQIYTTLSAAKQAFQALHKHRLCSFLKDNKPEWSPVYPPCREWMKDKLTAIAEDRSSGSLLT